jgi:hypothetical protein
MKGFLVVAALVVASGVASAQWLRIPPEFRGRRTVSQYSGPCAARGRWQTCARRTLASHEPG